MNIFIQAFNTLLYKPLFNALILLYEYLPGRDFGIAIIVLTILVRILLYPLMVRAIKSRKALSELQPKVKEVQEKFKDDQKRQMEEITKLFKQGQEIYYSDIMEKLNLDYDTIVKACEKLEKKDIIEGIEDDS